MVFVSSNNFWPQKPKVNSFLKLSWQESRAILGLQAPGTRSWPIDGWVFVHNWLVGRGAH
jgi:hypothetical protein